MLGAGLLAVLLGIGWRLSYTSPAHIAVSTAFLDLGEIVQEEGVVSASVDVFNDGEQTLELYRISTSCGCTTATMNMEPLNPGEQRTLTITFDPMVHSDQFGLIERAVYIQSSDPHQPEVVIDVVGTVKEYDL